MPPQPDLSRQREYRPPAAYLWKPWISHWAPNHGTSHNHVPIPLAQSSRPTDKAAKGGQHSYSRWQQTQNTKEFHKYIQNIPAHLLRTSNMKLISKADILKEIWQKIDPGNEETWGAAAFAILSHRWGDGELTFQDLQCEPDHDKLRKDRAGFSKLENFCRMAQKHGCDWAWADTCCIDKTSSAELDEAIRSMYRWYSDAAICIVHLADTVYLSDLRDDAWFTRGWTLQELLAPFRIKFFNKDWQPLTSDQNDKDRESTLIQSLSDITAIPRSDISFFRVSTSRIREKMYWAAQRATTRVEDVAYSLIGIFDVSMVIMYGEGERAFYRLQLAIAERTNTIELFLWTGRPSGDDGMLALEPDSFGVPDDEIAVELTADEREQFNLRDIAVTGEDFCEPNLKAKRAEEELRGPREGRDTETPETGGQDGSWMTRHALQGLLKCMEAETLRQMGPGLLRRMDGRVLRQIGPVLLKKYPELESLLDDSTLARLLYGVSWVPWGGQQYAMTGAGLAIDVVLYDAEFHEDADLFAPLEVHARANRGYLHPLDAVKLWTNRNRSGQDGYSYVTTSDPACLHGRPKLAVLDYCWYDMSHDPESLQNALTSAAHTPSNVHPAIQEIETRLYRGVFLRQSHERGRDCFERAFGDRASTDRSNVILVRRPKGGWNIPQRVYIY